VLATPPAIVTWRIKASSTNWQPKDQPTDHQPIANGNQQIINQPS
jgi:hypothetical protein